MPGFIDEPQVCCGIEYILEEEEKNIFMGIIVVGILIFMYLIIGVAFWRWPPNQYTNIDDMLTKLPDSHVEKLMNLMSDDQNEEDEYDTDEESRAPSVNDDESTAVSGGKKKRARVRINENFTEIVTTGDNPAYETSDDEIDEEEDAAIRQRMRRKSQQPQEGVRSRRMSRVSFAGGDDINDVEYNLIKEAQKFRRMSRMSVGSIRAVVPQPAQGRTKGVKFADMPPAESTILNVNDLEDLKVKIFNEGQRRASIKPFKKPFDLEVSDSE